MDGIGLLPSEESEALRHRHLRLLESIATARSLDVIRERVRRSRWQAQKQAGVTVACQSSGYLVFDEQLLQILAVVGDDQINGDLRRGSHMVMAQSTVDAKSHIVGAVHEDRGKIEHERYCGSQEAAAQGAEPTQEESVD